MLNKKKKCSIVSMVFLVSTLMLSWITSAAAAFTPEQQKIIEAAKKEGEVSWIDTIVVPPSADAIASEFKKYYGLPDSFKLNFQRLGTGPASTRIAQEVQSGTMTVDIFGAAAPTFFADLKKANALMKYDCPEYAKFKKARAAGLPYNEGYWQSAVAYCFAPITNPKLFSKKITSWYDLLDPALKGQKIMWPAVLKGGSPLDTYYGMRQVLPKSYFEQLAKQEVVFDRGSSVDATQRLSQGETMVAITNPFRIVQTAADSGVALDAHFPSKEGVVLLGQVYGLLAKAPHPNAAKLFIDFLLSDAGLNMYTRLEKTIVIKDTLEVPEEIKKYSPPISDLKVIPVNWDKMTEADLKTYQEEFSEIFKY